MDIEQGTRRRSTVKVHGDRSVWRDNVSPNYTKLMGESSTCPPSTPEGAQQHAAETLGGGRRRLGEVNVLQGWTGPKDRAQETLTGRDHDREVRQGLPYVATN